MRVAVVGAGIFGTTVALRLDGMGLDVDLFERHDGILRSASGINQYRIHRGYHYPRSSETGRYLLDTVGRFESEHREAMFDGECHLYGIASEDSLTSAGQFIAFMEQHDLPYQTTEDPRVDGSRIDLLIKARERLVDPQRLTTLISGRLGRSGVRLRLGETATETSTIGYDRVVVCGYATAGTFFDRNSGIARPSQFEVCEKPVVAMPPTFGRPSIVILDGPFMCIDPLGSGGVFVMGNVIHAIHATNVGLRPEVPDHIMPVIDSGVVPPPEFSRFDAFIESGRRFIPAMAEARHLGSMFTVRAVLPGLDHTDARPTVVTAVDERIVSVFSGKLATCVDAADRVAALLNV